MSIPAKFDRERNKECNLLTILERSECHLQFTTIQTLDKIVQKLTKEEELFLRELKY
jgi:hypothetical protein